MESIYLSLELTSCLSMLIIHTKSQQGTQSFQKTIFCPAKNGGHFEFFAKIFDSQGICEDYPFQVSTNISLVKNGGHFEFSIFFSKMGKTQKCMYLENHAR